MHWSFRNLALAVCICVNHSAIIAYGYDSEPVANASAGGGHEAEGTNEQLAPQAVIGDLTELVRDAKASFSPKTEGDLLDARRALLEAANQLDRYLATGGPNGAAWKKFLLWDAMQAQLQAGDSPDLNLLEQIYRRYLSDHAGLEWPVWRNVALALRKYTDLATDLADPKSHDSYVTELDRLADRLEAYGKSLQPEDVELAGASLGWFERRQQALPLVRAVRERLSRPNLFAQVSDHLVAAGTGRLVDEVEPVQDVILGTYIRGQGRTVGQARVVLMPDPKRALLQTVFEATNYAQTVGSNGPARIGSTNRTMLVGSQQLAIDERGFHPLPAAASASASSHIYGVWSTKRGCIDRIVRKVAWKRIPGQKSQSEQIASRHAEQRLVGRLAAEMNREVAPSNANYLEKVRYPLLRVGQMPRLLAFSTTTDKLLYTALHDGRGRLGAPDAPPAVNSQADLQLQFHESLPNNFAQGLLAGQTLDRDGFERLAKRYLGTIPKQMQDDEQRGPWAITFAAFNPVTLRIGPQKATITVRGRDFASDVRKFDTPMNITAHYRLENQAGAIRAVRQGDLEIFPPGFVPNSGQRLPARLTGIRNLLKHRFDKIFAPEIVSEGLVLPGQWQRVGRLDLIQLEADRGWMTLGWKPAAGKSRLASRAGQ